MIGPGVALVWGSPPPSSRLSSRSCWFITESTSELTFSAHFARQQCVRATYRNICLSFHRWNFMSPHMTTRSWFLVLKLCSFAFHSGAEGKPSSGISEVQLQIYPPTFMFLSKTVVTMICLCLQAQLSRSPADFSRTSSDQEHTSEKKFKRQLQFVMTLG